MRIGIDIDGVLTDLEGFYRDYVTRYRFLHGVKGNININEYMICDAYHISKEQDIDFFTNDFKEYENKYRARPFASEIIKKLKDEGNEIYIITARWKSDRDDEEGKRVRSIVLKWLEENDIYYDDIYFTKGDKTIYCKDLNIDVMIEDTPSNIENISKKLPVICYDAQYNKHCNGNNIIRCYSWYDIYEKLRNFFE